MNEEIPTPIMELYEKSMQLAVNMISSQPPSIPSFINFPSTYISKAIKNYGFIKEEAYYFMPLVQVGVFVCLFTKNEELFNHIPQLNDQQLNQISASLLEKFNKEEYNFDSDLEKYVFQYLFILIKSQNSEKRLIDITPENFYQFEALTKFLVAFILSAIKELKE